MKFFFPFIFIGLAFLACKGQQAADSKIEAPQLQNLVDNTDRPDVACYRIPALITTPNGNLVAAIDERVETCGDLRANRDINIVIRRSSDNGVNWSEIETIVDFPDGQSASDPSMIVDRETNEIFLFYNFMDLDKAPNVYSLHLIKSSDHGETWSAPEDITLQISKAGWEKNFKFITSGRGIQTDAGLLLHTLVNLESGLHLFGSNDHGKSWFLYDTAISPGDESKVIELADGSWMINSRINKGPERYVHRSDDFGKTWQSEPAVDLQDPGCNASLIRYSSLKNGDRKNRLLFANANTIDKRENMTVRLSYDEGKTWPVAKTIYPGSAAYSSLTVLNNGDIGLFFEKDDYSRNVFVRFSLAWLTDGKDSLK